MPAANSLAKRLEETEHSRGVMSTKRIGLSDAEDITVKGLNIIRRCKRVYLETYTSMLSVCKNKLEEFYGKELITADRELVEQNSEEILRGAKEEDVALLVVGDPFGATTHSDLILRASRDNIPFEIVHNASIITAVGCCGLQLYSFGEIVSIPFWSETWEPDSFYDRIVANRRRDLHTLCLLDIQVKEPTRESLMRKKKEYLPSKFMTVNDAASQLLALLQKKKDACECIPDFSYDSTTKCVGLSRIGSKYQKLIYCTLKDMENICLGEPLHSLIIPGKIHPLEEEYLKQYELH